MKKIVPILVLIVSQACQTSDDYNSQKHFRGKTISIKFVSQVNHNDWIKIDSFLFVHRLDFDPDAAAGVPLDSIMSNGEILRYYPLPASLRSFSLGDKKRVEKVIPTIILMDLIEHIDVINSKRGRYYLNIGANLWLNETLEIVSVNDENISIETNGNYSAVILTKD